MADSSVWPWQHARARLPCSQPGQTGSERRCLLFTAGNGEVMNEIASFIDACVVVQLCHQWVYHDGLSQSKCASNFFSS